MARPARLALLVAAAGALCACGDRRPPLDARGVYRYGSSEADMRPVSVGSLGTVSAPSEPGKPTAPPAAPAAPPTAPRPAPTAPPPPAPASTAYRVVEVQGKGSIRALCRLTEAASLRPLSIFKDNDKGCGAKERPSERAVFDPATLGLGNCVVRLRRIEAGKAWPEEMRSDERTFVLDQRECAYHPHVGVLRTGTQLVVVNSDRADHNIHAYRLTMSDTMFNFASEPGTRKDSPDAFIERPGAYPMKCDIHPWMSAYVLAVSNPYVDVTSEKDDAARGRKPGEAVLEDVPPGEYEVECWHEGMTETPTVQDGRIAAYAYSPDFLEVQKVVVAAGAAATVEFRIPPR